MRLLPTIDVRTLISRLMVHDAEKHFNGTSEVLWAAGKQKSSPVTSAKSRVLFKEMFAEA